MTVFHALILGIVQGFGEMLPISSSAHLVLLPWFLNFPDPGLAFDVALHVGTLLALLLYFWKDWLKIFSDLFLIIKTRKVETFEQKLAGYLILASIPGAFFGALLEKHAETTFRNPLIMVITLVIFGTLLLVADKKDKGERTLKDMKVKDSLIIGLSQAIALIPGVSRSGITMTAGLFSGFKKEDVAKFSFMMSAPIIGGAGILQLKDMQASEINTAFIIGFVASVISSLIAIGFLLTYIKKHGFKIFVYYRYFLALVILLLIFIRG